MQNPNKASQIAINYSKAFDAFRMPAFDVDAIVLLHRKNFEAASAAGQVAFDGIQAIVRRQIEMATDLMSHGLNGSNGFSDFAIGPEAIAKQTDAAKTAFDTGLANIREVGELLGKSGKEATDILARRVNESFSEFAPAK